jgi:hypothetical protein
MSKISKKHHGEGLALGTFPGRFAKDLELIGAIGLLTPDWLGRYLKSEWR